MKHYKYSLTKDLKDYIEFNLRHYCERQRELDEYKTDMMPSYTSKLDGIGGYGGRTTDITADTAVRLTTDIYIKRVESNCKAIQIVLSNIDDTDAALIAMVYWKSTHTVEGAAQIIHIGKSTAYNRINAILYNIALELGEINI